MEYCRYCMEYLLLSVQSSCFLSCMLCFLVILSTSYFSGPFTHMFSLQIWSSSLDRMHKKRTFSGVEIFQSISQSICQAWRQASWTIRAWTGQESMRFALVAYRCGVDSRINPINRSSFHATLKQPQGAVTQTIREQVASPVVLIMQGREIPTVGHLVSQVCVHAWGKANREV